MALFQPIDPSRLVDQQFFAPETKFNVLGGIQQVIEQGRAGAADRQLQGAVTASVQGTATPDQIGLMFKNDPAKALKVLEGVGVRNEQQAGRVAQAAFSIRSAPFEQRPALIQQAAQQIQQIGGDPSRILSMLNMDEEQQNEFASVFEQASLTVTQRTADALDQSKLNISEQKLELDKLLTSAQIGNLSSQVAERGRPKAPVLSAKAKDLISAGFLPGTPEFQQQMLALLNKSGTTVNIGAGETEEIKQIAKVQGRRFEKIIAEGENATRILSTVNQFDNIDVQTGALEPAKVATAAVFKSLGLDSIANSIANVTNAQALQSLTNRAVNDALNAASGVQTDGDAARARKTVVSLAGDPRANKFISATIKAVALRQQSRASFISGLVDSGANTFSQANTEWNKFIKKNPSLSSLVKNPATGLPLYFHEFEQTARQNNPGVSQQEINNAWRNVHGN